MDLNTGIVFKQEKALMDPTDIYDRSRGKNNLAAVGSPSWIRLLSGLYVPDLNGSSQYFTKSISDFRKNDYQGTISIWFKSSTTSTNMTMVSSNDDSSSSNYLFQFDIDTSGVIRVSNRQAGGTVNTVLGNTDTVDGVGHLGVLVSDGTSYSLYVDGQEESLTVDNGTNNGAWFADITNRDNLSIGVSKRSSLVNYFNGQLALATIWNVPLIKDQVEKLFENERHYFGV